MRSPLRRVACATATGLLLVVPLFAQSPAPPPPTAPRPGALPASGLPPRDMPLPATQSTGVIKGRVVDAATGLPIRRASVQLMARARQGDPRATSTDDEGRYEIRELADGEFLLTVRKPGYAVSSYGQRRYGEPGRPLKLRQGEILEKVDVALRRGGVITGRITDETGEPVLEAHVQVLRHRWHQGKRRLVHAGSAQTNDLGIYRVFGLETGEYYVLARDTPFVRPGDDAPTQYVSTYYPSGSDHETARPVAVGPGEESIADIGLLPVPVTRLSGIVVSTSGRPSSGARIMAHRRSDASTAGTEAPRGAGTRSDGTFTLHGLTPGTWMLTATSGDMGPFAAPGDQREVARLEVSVGGEHMEGVTLTLARGGIARGRLVFEGGTPPDPSGFRLVMRPVGDSFDFTGPSGPGTVNADGTFEVTGLAGRRVPTIVRMGPQTVVMGASIDGWSTKAVLVGGRDVQDIGIDFQPGQTVTGIQIVLSQDFPGISGTVADAQGNPMKDYSVIAFADDRDKWFLPSNRWVRTARADLDGLFKLENLAAGRYLVAALESVDQEVTGDPDELEKLRAFATDVTVGDHEKKTLRLTLVRP